MGSTGKGRTAPGQTDANNVSNIPAAEAEHRVGFRQAGLDELAAALIKAKMSSIPPARFPGESVTAFIRALFLSNAARTISPFDNGDYLRLSGRAVPRMAQPSNASSPRRILAV